MKTLVTGATGFIGGSVIRKLLEERKDVKVIVMRGRFVLLHTRNMKINLI